MNLFDKWQRRLQAEDPMEPASPPPFKMDDRVIVSMRTLGAQFVGGAHGTVIAVEFNSEPDSAFGPWIISVELDSGLKLAFDAAELTREPPPAPEPLETHAAGYEPSAPPEPQADTLGPWLQRAKELRYEFLRLDECPVYDDVVSEALSRDGLAAEVSAYLADVAAGGAA